MRANIGFGPRAAPAVLVAALSALMTAACGSAGGGLGEQSAGLKCVDDSPQCISQRQQVLSTYMADRSHAWIAEPAEPHAYASGVRMMAFSKKRQELSCDELVRAKNEADRAPQALSGAAYSGITTAQVARGLMLARDVSHEMSREMARRCRKT
jgi:hypothetical protein